MARRLCSERCNIATDRSNYGYVATHQLVRQSAQSLVAAICPTVLN